jgi:FkbM family methyltransferase
MIENKKLIYDVGMHKGEDSHYYLKKGFKVIGFEADPDLAELCRQRFSEEIGTGQLIIVEGAIIDLKVNKGIDGKIKFFKNRKTSVWGTVVNDWEDRNKTYGSESEIIEVPIINFSECLNQFGIPYYLKIDIEGMDPVCLKSLKDFTKRPDYISIESNKVSFEELKDEFAVFKQLGYDKFHVINQSRITSQKEPKDSIEGRYLNYKFERGSSGLFGNDLNKKWRSMDESIELYKKIFQGYKLLGDNSLINKLSFGRFFTRTLSRLTGIPGWYDTHAKHSFVI